MKDLGSAKRILGMEINRNRTQKCLSLTQKGYVQKVSNRFSMTEAKPVQTPLANHFKLCVSQSPQTEVEKKLMESIPYASAVGCLTYAMICTRPDLAYAIA